MNIACSNRRRAGSILTEIVVAMAILATASIPIAFSVVQEQKTFRGSYYHAIAMEVVDGEMEILMAGEWRAFPRGAQAYSPRADAAKNLPAGRFTLTVEAAFVRLEWLPEKGGKGGRVVREFKLNRSDAHK